MIRSIAPTGHLYTFEFHEQRSKVAEQEFKDHGISDYVTVIHKDVCEEGFGLDHVADAVFLDLPKPWEAVASAKKALKLEGMLLCKSPAPESNICHSYCIGLDSYINKVILVQNRSGFIYKQSYFSAK